MGSANVIVGDAVADKALRTISLPGTYPHGLSVNEEIDRLIVTNCIRPDLGAVGDSLEVIKASTGEHLGSLRTSEKEGAAPVETVFVPHSDPPVAYVTNMMTHTLAAAVWNPQTQDFDIQEVFDFETVGASMPLEMYFNRAADRLYVTTAAPGHFHIFDISAGPLQPKLLKQLPTAGGAHHVAITPDERLAYVQNSLLNLPGMSDGSITVIDLEKQAVVDTIDTFKEQNLTPNSLTLLPEWYHQMGHFNNGPGA
jgi:DNA-binding beta-propeller fold protein YncE